MNNLIKELKENNQDFMKKFNIEASRLNNWVKSPNELAKETDIPIDEIEKSYNSNLQIGRSCVKLLSMEEK